MGERAYLAEAMKTHFRLYEVENVDLDQGFLLNDLWTGESYQVRERSATHFLVQWDLMATRLMRKENDILLQTPRDDVQPLVARLGDIPATTQTC